MTNFARIVDDVAVDVIADPENSFHPDIAAQFVAVPDNVAHGWRRGQGGAWSAPEAAPDQPAPPTYPKVGPIHFQMLFTAEEAVVANDLKAADKALAAFWKLIDDPRTDVVDLGLTSVQNAVEHTLTAVKAAGVDVDVPARKAAILSGVLK